MLWNVEELLSYRDKGVPWSDCTLSYGYEHVRALECLEREPSFVRTVRLALLSCLMKRIRRLLAPARRLRMMIHANAVTKRRDTPRSSADAVIAHASAGRDDSSIAGPA